MASQNAIIGIFRLLIEVRGWMGKIDIAIVKWAADTNLPRCFFSANTLQVMQRALKAA
jgi:hypothetical protein